MKRTTRVGGNQKVIMRMTCLSVIEAIQSTFTITNDNTKTPTPDVFLLLYIIKLKMTTRKEQDAYVVL